MLSFYWGFGVVNKSVDWFGWDKHQKQIENWSYGRIVNVQMFKSVALFEEALSMNFDSLDLRIGVIIVEKSA